MNDKQIHAEEEQQEELIAAEETALKEEIDEVAVHDADEAIHLTHQTISDENKLHDADDAVHNTISPTTYNEEMGKEKDPDELAHEH